MKRALARRWAAALESGEYKQGTWQLRKGNKFCCLAVLCNLHAQDHPEIAAKQKLKSAYMGEVVALPAEVCEWAGMKSPIGGIRNDESLANMNDVQGLTFPEIAKVIRKHWKEL